MRRNEILILISKTSKSFQIPHYVLTRQKKSFENSPQFNLKEEKLRLFEDKMRSLKKF